MPAQVPVNSLWVQHRVVLLSVDGDVLRYEASLLSLSLRTVESSANVNKNDCDPGWMCSHVRTAAFLIINHNICIIL